MTTLFQFGWHFLLLAIAGELVTPFLLAPFVPGYRHTTMAISSLGTPGSPVRLFFNLWMFAAGFLFLAALPCLYREYYNVSKPLSLTLILFLAVFAAGACICSCFFSVNETREIVTTASKIHGAGSAIGFILLLFVPLLLAVLSFKATTYATAIFCGVSFLLSFACFVLFILSDKPTIQSSGIAKEGLWQRLNLFFAYLPLGWIAVLHLAK